MYEYKVFTANTQSEQSLNELLAKISHSGWEPIQIDWNKMQVFARQPLTLNDQEKIMKNWKLTEQLRDLVLLLTLVCVGYLALKAPDRAPAGENARMRGVMEQRMKRGLQDRVGPDGPWWKEEDSKPERKQRGERGKRGKKEEKVIEPVKVYQNPLGKGGALDRTSGSRGPSQSLFNNRGKK